MPENPETPETSEPVTPPGACELAASVRSGERSATEMVEATLARLQETEPAIHAFLEVYEDKARERAETLDRRLADGEDPGPLAGVPVAVKDNLAVEGHRLTCASRLLADHRTPMTATPVQRLLDAGAVVVGKTNLDEFGMGSSCERSAFGPTHNPWDLDRVPGGSSGGSAAAVAAGVVPLALGSDTGGSVRQPAAFCGVVGLRPTWGRVSRWGLVAFASSLDQVGPLTRSVRDASLALSMMAGPDPRDATCVDRGVDRAAPEPNLAPDPESEGKAAAGTDLQGWKLGILRELEELQEPEGIEHLRGLGAEIVEVSVPLAPAALATYQVVSSCEASTNLARYDGVRYGERAAADSLDELYVESRSRGLGPEVQRRVLLGTFALARGFREATYRRAQRLRAELRRQLLDAFQGPPGVDLLIAPTTPGVAFPLGERLDDPLAMYGSDRLAVLASLAGLPAIAVPSGLDTETVAGKGLPLSLQILGRPFDESRVLRAAAAFERAAAFVCRPASETFEAGTAGGSS